MAASLIAVLWLIAIFLFGLIMHLLDGDTFKSFGEGAWWATQTVTTVGYGDIVPTGAPACMLAMMEGMAGVFYIAVMVSRLVSLYAVTRSDNQAPDPAPPHQP